MSSSSNNIHFQKMLRYVRASLALIEFVLDARRAQSASEKELVVRRELCDLLQKTNDLLVEGKIKEADPILVQANNLLREIDRRYLY